MRWSGWADLKRPLYRPTYRPTNRPPYRHRHTATILREAEPGRHPAPRLGPIRRKARSTPSNASRTTTLRRAEHSPQQRVHEHSPQQRVHTRATRAAITYVHSYRYVILGPPNQRDRPLPGNTPPQSRPVWSDHGSEHGIDYGTDHRIDSTLTAAGSRHSSAPGSRVRPLPASAATEASTPHATHARRSGTEAHDADTAADGAYQSALRSQHDRSGCAVRPRCAG